MSEESPGEFVRRRRRSAGMSQRDLAELSRVGARFISELEADKPTLRMDVVNRVLAVFGKRLGVVEIERGTLSADIPTAPPEEGTRP